MSQVAQVFYANAIRLIDAERRTSRRLDAVYRILVRHNMRADLADWLANPFIRTALQILKKFQSNYKIGQAISLLEEAGTEAETEARKKKKR